MDDLSIKNHIFFGKKKFKKHEKFYEPSEYHPMWQLGAKSVGFWKKEKKKDNSQNNEASKNNMVEQISQINNMV